MLEQHATKEECEPWIEVSGQQSHKFNISSSIQKSFHSILPKVFLPSNRVRDHKVINVILTRMKRVELKRPTKASVLVSYWNISTINFCALFRVHFVTDIFWFVLLAGQLISSVWHQNTKKFNFKKMLKIKLFIKVERFEHKTNERYE